MGTWQRLFILRLASLAALAFSAALLTDYWRPGALVCGFESSCEDVLASRFSKVAGVPLPVFGLLGFTAIFACSLSPRPRSTQLLRLLALVAAVVGGALIFVQFFVLHNLCPYCMVVDSCALVVAFAAFGWRPDALGLVSGRARFLWLASAIVCLGLGVAFGTARSWMATEEVAVPPQVSAHWVDNKITIVEVVDFECPACRNMHKVLTQFLREQGEDIHFVRLVAPMEKHQHARDAARAYLCAVEQNKGDEMAEKLFAAEDLTPEGCERIAVSLGIAVERYRSCVKSAKIEEQINANVAWVDKASPQGLPCIWVQDLRLSGAQDYAELTRAVAKAFQHLRAGNQ